MLLEAATTRVDALYRADARLVGVRLFPRMAYRELAGVYSKLADPQRAAAAVRKSGVFDAPRNLTGGGRD